MSVSTPNSPRDRCVVCRATLQDGGCDVCGVNQDEAGSLIQHLGQLLTSDLFVMSDLCERVRTTATYDVKTKRLFRRLAKLVPNPEDCPPRRPMQILRQHVKISSRLLSMTKPNYQSMICHEVRTALLHDAKNELRRYLIAFAILTFASFALARWLTLGVPLQMIVYPVVASILLGVAALPLEFVVNRYGGM